MPQVFFTVLTLLAGIGLLQADDAAYPLSLKTIRVRDPFIVADAASQTYYLYSSSGTRLMTDVGDAVEVYRSPDLKQWSRPAAVFQRPAGFWGGQMIWAPEVHPFGNAYYMFVTFDKPGGRGTQILRADAPTGPFQVLNHATTPPDQQCLDGTSWVDASGQNWLVYCEEWTRIQDGAIRAVRMAPDWSARQGESVILFHASQAPWAAPIQPGCFVTDGPYLHRTGDGKLVMIWSSFTQGSNYAVGVAESASGEVTGPWVHLPKPLFQKDGGHAMIFRAFDGRLLLALHQPNGGGQERVHLFELDDRTSLRLGNEVDITATAP